MAELYDLACPELSGMRGLDADQRRRELPKEVEYLETPELPSKHHHTAFVDPVDLKDVLRNVETNTLAAMSTFLSGVLIFRSVTRPGKWGRPFQHERAPTRRLLPTSPFMEDEVAAMIDRSRRRTPYKLFVRCRTRVHQDHQVLVLVAGEHHERLC